MAAQTIPLLKELRASGGTFYTFSSSTKDLIMLFSNSNLEMNFSKFACLKLPDWQNVTTQRIYRDPVDVKSVNDTPATDDANVFFPKAYFQNYMENFLAYVDDVRNDTNFANFTEAAFWKALQSVADSDFNLATDGDNTIQLDTDTTYLDNAGTARQKYKEKAASSGYTPVIQFIGDVNAINHKQAGGKEYLEVFAHVANSQGRVDGTLLKPNDSITTQVPTAQVPTSAGPDEVVGRTTEYTTAPGADKTYAKAIYDTIGKQYNVTGDKDFLQIDWDDLNATASASKFNKGNFDFNCVLLYYDVQEKDNPASKRRNLYGILVLDKMTSVSAVTDRIQTQTKYQPDANQAGNATSFLFNLMFSNNTNQITSTVSVNDTALVAMQLYQKALGELQVIVEKYAEHEKQVLAMTNDIATIKANMLGLQNRIISDTEITSIKNQLNANTQKININHP